MKKNEITKKCENIEKCYKIKEKSYFYKKISLKYSTKNQKM